MPVRVCRRVSLRRREMFVPRVSKTPIEGFAHCRNARCAGYGQEKVSAERVLSEWTYVELGGDMPGVEKSQVYVEFVDQGDAPCPHCGVDRVVTDKPRPTYQPLSGHDQNGLLYLSGFNPAAQAASQANAEVEGLRAELEALKALIAEKAA